MWAKIVCIPQTFLSPTAMPSSAYYQNKTPKYLMTSLFVRGLSQVLMVKLFTTVDLLRENNTEFVLL